jgi:hypothetical protein
MGAQVLEFIPRSRNMDDELYPQALGFKDRISYDSYTFSLYLTGNTSRHSYKAQSVNALPERNLPSLPPQFSHLLPVPRGDERSPFFGSLSSFIRSIRTNHITALFSSFPNLWTKIWLPLAVKQTLLSFSLHETYIPSPRENYKSTSAK